MNEIKKMSAHSLLLENRNKLTISGITDVGNFNEESMTLYSDMGEISIKGENLQVSILNIESGDFCAEGKINSVEYSDRKQKNPGFFAKVFK